MAIQIIDENYAEAYALEAYLIEEASDKSRILGYINECICLEHGELDKISYINESLIDNVKQFFSRIWEFLKKAFNKFTERLGELFTTDKKFLEKYKDIILKKPWKVRTISNAYVYSVENMNTVTALEVGADKILRKYNLDKSDIPEDYTEEKFIEDMELTSKLSGVSKDIKEIGELISSFVKGEQKDEINISMYGEPKKLFEFCSKFDNIKNRIEKNQSALNTSQQKILSEITKIQNTASKTADNLNKESVFSNVYGSYITEEEGITVNKPSSTTTSNGNNSNSSSGTAGAASEVKQANDTASKHFSNQNRVEGIKNETDKDKANQTKSNVDRLVGVYENYFKYAVAVQTNVMTVAMAIYKDYMKLLRVHVRDYVGAESNTDGQQTSSSENQTNNNNTGGNNISHTEGSKSDINTNTQTKLDRNGDKAIINAIKNYAKNNNLTKGQVYNINYNGKRYILHYKGISDIYEAK